MQGPIVYFMQERTRSSNSLDPKKVKLSPIDNKSFEMPTLPTPGVSFTLLTALNKQGGAGGGEA